VNDYDFTSKDSVNFTVTFLDVVTFKMHYLNWMKSGFVKQKFFHPEKINLKLLNLFMTTKAEQKALRKQNRALRKKLRKEKKIKFNEIVEAAGSANITIDLDAAEPKLVDAFNQIWPILKPVLEYAELVNITGEKVDKVLRTVIDLGNRISTGDASQSEQTVFISTLDTIWNPVKAVLGIIVTFTSDKVDKVINQIIEIGDWITQD
jgi:hypothetical protein